jgi:hypothetical protein
MPPPPKQQDSALPLPNVDLSAPSYPPGSIEPSIFFCSSSLSLFLLMTVVVEDLIHGRQSQSLLAKTWPQGSSSSVCYSIVVSPIVKPSDRGNKGSPAPLFLPCNAFFPPCSSAFSSARPSPENDFHHFLTPPTHPSDEHCWRGINPGLLLVTTQWLSDHERERERRRKAGHLPYIINIILCRGARGEIAGEKWDNVK